MHIDRPHHSQTPTTASRSPEALSPTVDADEGYTEPAFGSYTEPVSEGEEDEQMDIAAVRGADEARYVRLAEEQVTEAVLFREEVLRRAREGGGDSNGKGKGTGAGVVSDEDEDEAADAHVPYLRRRSSVPVGERPQNLAIDPLAPSSQFDKSFWSKLSNAASANGNGNGKQAKVNGVSASKVKGGKSLRHAAIAEEDEDEEREAAGLADGEEEDEGEVVQTIYVKNIRSAAGKKISVPVRIEPKVIFANERTFLVCFFLSPYLFVLFEFLCPEPFVLLS